MSINHFCFSSNIAKIVGVEASTIFSDLKYIFQVDDGQILGNFLIDGTYWMKIDKDFLEHNYDFLPTKKIYDNLKLLERKKLIKSRDCDDNYSRFYTIVGVSRNMNEKKYNNENIKKYEEKDGYIYLIKTNNKYKIGKTLKIKERIIKYKTENPNKIKVILCEKVVNYSKNEKILLDCFKEKNIRGEWFKLNKNDVEYIRIFLNNNKTT
jgi:asparagine N-glycosylation enzyme membrane subunit Stt3